MQTKNLSHGSLLAVDVEGSCCTKHLTTGSANITVTSRDEDSGTDVLGGDLRHSEAAFAVF